MHQNACVTWLSTKPTTSDELRLPMESLSNVNGLLFISRLFADVNCELCWDLGKTRGSRSLLKETIAGQPVSCMTLHVFQRAWSTYHIWNKESVTVCLIFSLLLLPVDVDHVSMQQPVVDFSSTTIPCARVI